MVRPRLRSLVPAPTIRLRLTLLYGGVFLASGAVLLTIGYALVRHNLGGPRRLSAAELRGLGLAAPRPRVFGRPPFDARFARVGGEIRAQLRAQALHRLLVEYAIALGAMTVISVAAGWMLAGRALRPLRQIIATARRVSGQNLGERIALQGPADELRELADTFDGMLARLDSAFASQRHFVANASHELRTPLAVMRTEIDVTLADPAATVAELRSMADGVLGELDRCERLISALLFLARSEAITGRSQVLDVAALAADCLTDLRARAREAGLAVTADLRPAIVRAEPALVERAIANLIDNAIRHNRPGGELIVRTASRPDGVELLVCNSGPAIDAATAATLTEPFRRLDRGTEGFGLGLSIVRSVVDAHGGRLTVTPRAAGGLDVRIELPRSDPAGTGERPAASGSPAPRDTPALTRT